MSVSPIVSTFSPSPMDTSTTATIPPYAVALVIVVAVVSLGLLIAIIYYCRIKENRGQLMRESPERDPEQLRGEQVVHHRHVQIPDIPISLAANSYPEPSPSIFSRGNFVLEVLEDVEKKESNATNTEAIKANENEKSTTTKTHERDLRLTVSTNITYWNIF